MLVVTVTLALLLCPLEPSSLFCWALGSAGVAKVLLLSTGDQDVLQQQSYSALHTQEELCVGEAVGRALTEAAALLRAEAVVMM